MSGVPMSPLSKQLVNAGLNPRPHRTLAALIAEHHDLVAFAREVVEMADQGRFRDHPGRALKTNPLIARGRALVARCDALTEERAA